MTGSLWEKKTANYSSSPLWKNPKMSGAVWHKNPRKLLWDPVGALWFRFGCFSFFSLWECSWMLHFENGFMWRDSYWLISGWCKALLDLYQELWDHGFGYTAPKESTTQWTLLIWDHSWPVSYALLGFCQDSRIQFIPTLRLWFSNIPCTSPSEVRNSPFQNSSSQGLWIILYYV